MFLLIILRLWLSPDNVNLVKNTNVTNIMMSYDLFYTNKAIQIWSVAEQAKY